MPPATKEHLIETIYQATYQPERWPQAMGLLTTLTASKSAGLFIHDRELRQVSGFFPFGVSKAVAALYRTLGARIDPGFKRMREEPMGVSRVIVDLEAPDNELGLYRKLMLQPAGIHSILGVNLLNDHHVHAGIGIHRGREQGPFEPATRELVESVAPHFTRAITIYREFAKVNAHKHAYHAGLERLSTGTVLFDHLARPVYMNPRARFLFESHPAVRLREDLPVVVDREMARRVQTTVISAIEGDIDEQSLGLRHPATNSPLVLRIVAVSAWKESPTDWPGLARCVMYVANPELSPSVPAPTLQQVFGLSAAESEVAVGLANGFSVERVAELQGVTKDTVKSQLKTVFRKTGVNRQQDLIRVILALPVIHGDHDS